jgi:hypothetical protein
MKTLKFLLIAFILVIALKPGRVSANSFSPAKVLGEPCKESKITWRKPGKGHLSHEKIGVCFVVNDNGDVTEVNVKTNDQKTKRQIEKQFFDKSFKGLEACVINCVEVGGR